MKRIVFVVFALLMALALTLGISAAEELVTDEETTSDIEGGVVGVVEEIDKTMSGVEMWENAKAWITEHLSTVVGVLMTISTVVVGFATKFSFIPKILSAFKSLFTSMGKWYNDNIDQLKALRGLFDGFFKDVKEIIEEVRAQSEDNNELRHELAEARETNNKALAENSRLKVALLKVVLLQSDELEDLIQMSPLTQHDLDKHKMAYNKKREEIEALLKEEDYEVERHIV